MELITLIGTLALFMVSVGLGVRILMARTERLDKKWDRTPPESSQVDPRPEPTHLTPVKATELS